MGVSDHCKAARRRPPALIARLLVASLVAAALLTAGCGGTQRTADLFVIKRTGSIAGANLTLLVSDDGTATCNGGPRKQIGGDLLVEARGLSDDFAADVGKPVAGDPPTNSIYRFTVQTGAGSANWVDGSLGLPESFLKISQFTRKVAKGACGLVR